jgi:hypothetical protein
MKNKQTLFLAATAALTLLFITGCGGGGNSDGNGGSSSSSSGSSSGSNSSSSGSSSSSSGGGSSAPVIRLAASRTSGAAPLAVFFDTEGTTSSRTDKPIHELQYAWDFGAGTEADVSSGGRYFKGFNSAHVFETPGTYAVTLTVKDATGTASTTTVNIEVTDGPAGGWQTFCFSNDTDFSGCPAGATHVQTAYWSGDAGEDVLDHVGVNRRLLLKRGGTFSYSQSSPIGNGPLHIGAFGSGAQPMIRFTGTRPNGWTYGPADNAGADVRFSDIHFNVYSGDSASINGGTGPSLYLRITNENGEMGFTSDIFVVDSKLSAIHGNPGYASGTRIVVIGTDFGPSLSHSVYGECQPKAIYTGNYFHDVINGGRTGLRFAVNTCSSHNILASNNRFDNIPASAIQIEKTTDATERWLERDIVIENNRFSRTSGVQISRDHGFDNITIRNNIFDLGDGGTAIFEQDAIRDHPEWARGVHGLWVRNNLIYDHSTQYPTWTSSVLLQHADAQDVVFENNIFVAVGVGTPGGWLRPLEVRSEALPELTFRNNLYYYPDMTDGQLFSITGVGTGNLAWWQAYGGHGLDQGGLIGNPLFVDQANGNFRLQSGSPARDKGIAAGAVFDDIDGVSRSDQAPWDIGPYEYH